MNHPMTCIDYALFHYFLTRISSFKGNKEIQNFNVILCSVAPQNGAQSRDRFLLPSVIGSETDVPDMWLELFDDLLCIAKLLRGQIGIVQ